MLKNTLLADLLKNLGTISKDPPSFIIYVYKVWQWKFDEMKHLVHVFMHMKMLWKKLKSMQPDNLF